MGSETPKTIYEKFVDDFLNVKGNTSLVIYSNYLIQQCHLKGEGVAYRGLASKVTSFRNNVDTLSYTGVIDERTSLRDFKKLDEERFRGFMETLYFLLEAGVDIW